MGGGRRALVFGAAATAFLAACGKSRARPPDLQWFDDVALASDEARRLHRPLLLFFFATWDCAGNELEHKTFADGAVADLLHRHFVIAKIDCSDDEDPSTVRLSREYEMKGIPTLVVMHVAADRELLRFTEFVPAERFVREMAAARARFADIEAALPAPRLDWFRSPREAIAAAIRRQRPLLAVFGQTYDEYARRRRRFFDDPIIARFASEELVLLDIAWDDREVLDETTFAQFRLHRGSPDAVVIDAARNHELGRLWQWGHRKEDFEQGLRDAVLRYRYRYPT